MTREDLFREYERRGRLARYASIPRDSPWYQKERTVQLIAQKACYAAARGEIMVEVQVCHPLDVRKGAGV